jgi:molybdenum cofactor cytidylyltransferase
MIRRVGVILAAGRGRRMGRTKQLVPWPNENGAKPLVCAAYDAIRPICDDMVVVLGHEAQAVTTALADRPFQPVYGDPAAPMFESIRAALRAAQLLDPAATVVLQPADQPQVERSTLSLLVDWSMKRPMQTIIPAYRGKGGHPAMIPAAIAATLCNAECPTGLGDFWLVHSDWCHRVAVDDPGVVRDIDTMADLGGEW